MLRAVGDTQTEVCIDAPSERDLRVIGPRARVALDLLERDAIRLRKALKRNAKAREALGVVVALTS